MRRKIVDGGRFGIKLDKLRHSRFEFGEKASRFSKKYEDKDMSEASGKESVHHISAGFRKHGGGLMDHDGSHFEKGPRGYLRDDHALLEDVSETLRLNSSIDPTEISVEVLKGIVYLKGFVSNLEMKKLVHSSVENISGVLEVKNLLTFK